VQERSRLWMCALLMAAMGCATPEEEDAATPERQDAPSEASRPTGEASARHTGAALIVEAPPALADIASEAATRLRETEVPPELTFAERLERFAAFASAPLSVVLAEAEGPSQRAEGGWESTWRLARVMRGPAVPERFTLLQARDEDERPSCGMVEGRPGRQDVLVLEPTGDGSFRVLSDDLGAIGFLRGGPDHKQLTWQMGPTFDAAALLGALEESP
jgi:hypothetical protein